MLPVLRGLWKHTFLGKLEKCGFVFINKGKMRFFDDGSSKRRFCFEKRESGLRKYPRLCAIFIKILYHQRRLFL
jgi:hypothetical protein